VHPTLIPLLVGAVLWLGTASSDSFRILHIAAFKTLCKAHMGVEPTLICGTTSFASGYGWTRTRQRQCGVVQKSMSVPG
jgi:hypothetical protein